MFYAMRPQVLISNGKTLAQVLRFFDFIERRDGEIYRRDADLALFIHR
jgi:hypothetical protein